MNEIQTKLLTIAFIIFAFARVAPAQTTAFTYQGRLTDSSMQANGTYDLGFALFNAATGGTQIGTPQTRAAVNVTNGIFTVQLDFGAMPFAPGDKRFLEIAVKRPADSTFTTLMPRQELTSAPFAIQSLNAATANNLTACVACVTNAQIASVDGAKITGTVANATNAASATTAGNVSGVVAITNGGTGSATQNFVDLTTAQTVAGDKTFSGTVSGNAINSQTQYNIGGNHVLSVVGEGNLFVGVDAGENNTTGISNTLLGTSSDVASGSLNYATAIGAGAIVSTSNTIALGRGNGSDRVIAPGGIALGDSKIYLRGGSDNNHTIFFNPTINGIQFNAFDDFRWVNAKNNRVNMSLFGDSGNLAIVGSYQQFSDARLKTNVQTFAGALDAVTRLRGVTFNWKPELNKSSDRQIGFIAQEVEQVLPELVSTDKQGYKTVAYSNAVPVLVEAVKEQNAQIERQQKQIDELKQIVCAIKPVAGVCRDKK